jgi:hypothetical protein
MQGQDYILEMALPSAPLGANDMPAPGDRTKIGHTQTKSFSRSTEAVDSTTDDTAPHATNEPGEKTSSIEGGGLFVYSDAGQQVIEEAYEQQHANGKYWYFFTPVNADGSVNANAKTYGQVATLTQLDLEGETNSRIEYSFSADFSGKLETAGG